MISAPTHRAHMLRSRTLLFCSVLFVIIFLLATRAEAQNANGGIDSDPGMGMRNGRNTIDGRVTYPPGLKSDKRLRVRLSSVVVGDFTTMTDQDGAFAFRRLREGTYYITVDAGKEYLPATETVSIFGESRSTMGQIIAVQIELKLKPTDRNKAGVVNAALAGVPKPALDLYKRALEAGQAGDHKKAIEFLKSALALYPEFVLALNEIGVQYHQSGELDKAVEAFRTAIKLSPDAFILRLNYGFVLMQKKEFVGAEAELRRATELKDSSTAAHLYRGKAFIKLGKYLEAEKELQRVINLGGDDVAMAQRYLGAIYIEQKKNAQAVEALEKYLSLAPKAKDADQIREIVKQLHSQK